MAIFSTYDLYRVFPEKAISPFEWGDQGEIKSARIIVGSAGDCAIALKLLEANESQGSFVVFDDKRYEPFSSSVQPYAITRPANANELYLDFGVEYVAGGEQPWVYLFTYGPEEWASAKQALAHLLEQDKLSPRSFIEGDHQGVYASNLEQPLGSAWISVIREAAYATQNDLYEKPESSDEDWGDEDGDKDEDRGGES